jgi:hypothetical protein
MRQTQSRAGGGVEPQDGTLATFSLPADIQTSVVLGTTRHPFGRFTLGVLVIAPVPLRRIQPGKYSPALWTIHSRLERTRVARRRGVAMLILQTREGLAAVLAGMSLSPRVFPGTRAPVTSTFACASRRLPGGCGRGCRRWEGRCGCEYGRGCGLGC